MKRYKILIVVISIFIFSAIISSIFVFLYIKSLIPIYVFGESDLFWGEPLFMARHSVPENAEKTSLKEANLIVLEYDCIVDGYPSEIALYFFGSFRRLSSFTCRISVEEQLADSEFSVIVDRLRNKLSEHGGFYSKTDAVSSTFGINYGAEGISYEVKTDGDSIFISGDYCF
ncbi:MAG: hypothetical protein J5563_00330 [Clostridia bacterium]|nr:hypothetical protein [Clostridia bacterium]